MPDTVDPPPAGKSLEELATRYLDDRGALFLGEHVSQVFTVVTTGTATQGGR